MSGETENQELIGRFAREIAQLHERSISTIKRDLQKIVNPDSEHDRALSSYYLSMDQDQRSIALISSAVEGLLHDLFFLFDENREFKIILDAGKGPPINLAEAVDVIQAFPLESIEKYSGADLEANRQLAYLSEALNLGETRQQRRTRILAKKHSSLPSPDNS